MTAPAYERFGVTVHHGRCLDVLRAMPDRSVDAVVCDPPYGLAEHRTSDIVEALGAWLGGDREHVPDGRGFMGREWDRFVPPPAVWDECLRVLRPGGYLVAFAGTRTFDLMGISIRLAGFEIRDGIGSALRAWMHGQGFPKGTSQLKPAWEPILVARKPFKGSEAANVRAHGTGALNIDATRTATVSAGPGTTPPSSVGGRRGAMAGPMDRVAYDGSAGRWPANVVLTHAADCGSDDAPGACVPGCPVAELDAQSGVLTSGLYRPEHADNGKEVGTLGAMSGRTRTTATYGDSGGASRFFPVFRWEAKTPTAERPMVNGVSHPTVKPVALMRWLVRLVCPPGGDVLDPFAGSGTTGQAARAEGMRAVLIEREAAYLSLIAARLDGRGRTTAADSSSPPEGAPRDLLDLLDEDEAS